jgi:hypothetical protein
MWIGSPIGGIALAIGHHLQHRHTECFELGLASLRIEHDLAVDQHIDERLPSGATMRVMASAHDRAIEDERACVTRFDARDQVIDERAVEARHIGLVDGDANHRRTVCTRC